MERLGDLLFELSSGDRMQILSQLQSGRLKLSQVSRHLGLTVSEVSRHLQRLNDSGLIQKGGDGRYGVTPYGELVLSQLGGLDFVSKHREYFMEYDVSRLPYQFIDRLGELSEGTFGEEIFGNLEYAEHEFREAEEFVWVMSDQILKSLIPVIMEKVKQPFDFRFICPQAVMLPDSKAPLPTTMPRVQKRVLPEVDLVVVVTDKASGFCLPQRSGRIDYRNLHGDDTKFRKWCTDLFLHYWRKAKPFTL